MKRTTMACLLACCSLGVIPPTLANTLSELTLNYGVVSSKPNKRIKDSYPLFSHVAQQLAHHGYKDASIKVYSSIDELVSAIQTGQVDIVSSSVYPSLLLKQRAKAEPFLVRWKKGDASYSSVFVSRSTNHYRDLSDLQGKVIGFEDRGSTSGYFLPMVALLSQGLKVQHLASIQSKPDDDKVGYFFFDDMLRETNEVNMSMWAAKGMVDAIAFSSSNWSNPKDTPVALKQQLHVFNETGYYPRSVMSVSPKLDPMIAAELKQLLLDLDSSEVGRSVLSSYQKTKKFTLIDSHSEKLLYEAEQMLEKLEAKH